MTKYEYDVEVWSANSAVKSDEEGAAAYMENINGRGSQGWEICNVEISDDDDDDDYAIIHWKRVIESDDPPFKLIPSGVTGDLTITVKRSPDIPGVYEAHIEDFGVTQGDSIEEAFLMGCEYVATHLEAKAKSEKS